MEISLKALRYVMAAATVGSISEEANQMHAAPSAVRTAVNRAEEAFGPQLITRHFVKGIASAATWQILTARIQPPLDECKAPMGCGSDMSRTIRKKVRAIAHPGLPETLAARAAPVPCKPPGLALAMFKVLRSGRTLVVLDLNDLGDSVAECLSR